MQFPHTLVLSLALFLSSAFSAQSQSLPDVPHGLPIPTTCRSACGSIPVKYPFGTGFGCGSPIFARYVKCVAGTLQLSTDTGVYPISSVDYAASTLIVSDPLMSTCNSMQNSGSFGLGPTVPFQVTSDDIFVLLGCSTSSPVFDSDVGFCDAGAANVCRGLYSCRGVTGIGLQPNGPTSTCCVYKPLVGPGSGYDLDLPKLQCSSYTCVNGFGGREGDPSRWTYGISLQFNGTDGTDACEACEKSAGACGFNGLDASFVCVCPSGVNTTANCYGQGYAWSGGWREKSHSRMGILTTLILAWFLLHFFISPLHPLEGPH